MHPELNEIGRRSSEAAIVGEKSNGEETRLTRTTWLRGIFYTSRGCFQESGRASTDDEMKARMTETILMCSPRCHIE